MYPASVMSSSASWRPLSIINPPYAFSKCCAQNNGIVGNVG